MRAVAVAGLSALALAGCQTMGPSHWGAKANPPALSLSDAPDSSLTGRELAAALISASDKRCEDYLVGVTVQRNLGNSGFSILGSALTTVGSLVSEGRAANAFAGAGGFANSTANTLDDTIFGRHEFAVIYDAVKRGRTVERNAFLADMDQFDGMGRYEILSRITPYDHNCGITYGLVELSRAVQEVSNRQPELQPDASPRSPGSGGS